VVLMPSRAADAAGMLRSALECEDPVLYLEHKHLLRQPYTRTPMPGPGFRVPIGKGRVVVPGDDLTIVTWGATVEKSRQAAGALLGEGASVGVVDLRSIRPWDSELVAETVAHTGRVMVVHEDTLTGGFGGEIAAWIAEHCFGDLDAPLRRVAALDTHVPYEPSLERAVLPQVEDIVSAARDLLAF
jgi:2-oxoisovalerate dehydrogenase E1 component